jgi:hypothetical protein
MDDLDLVRDRLAVARSVTDVPTAKAVLAATAARA